MIGIIQQLITATAAIVMMFAAFLDLLGLQDLRVRPA